MLRPAVALETLSKPYPRGAIFVQASVDRFGYLLMLILILGGKASASDVIQPHIAYWSPSVSDPARVSACKRHFTFKRP